MMLSEDAEPSSSVVKEEASGFEDGEGLRMLFTGLTNVADDRAEQGEDLPVLGPSGYWGGSR